MNKNQSIRDVMREKDKNLQSKKYEKYVKEKTPTFSCFSNCIKAFILGGIICTIGQVLLNWYKSFGISMENAQTWTSISLILLSIVLTGFNLYPLLTKWGGAGAVVPITGFANGVVAPALEYKKEGQVFGIGCKIFIIAGPVILYGIFSSWVLGVIYYIVKQLG